MPVRSTDCTLSLEAAAAADLVAWYRDTARDLPWRRTRDPYRILVSEIMLQQTRVPTVIERYDSFLARFPDLQALARASEEQVLAEWSGLGYYRRAHNLHRLARAVVEQHGGRLPAAPERLQELPGIGPYTAAAVASIAFDQPCLSIDGNVARVLCRTLGIEADPGRAAVKQLLREAVHTSLRRHPPGELNQALMELGARVCTPRSPACRRCPLASTCVARALDATGRIPPPRRQRVRDVEEAAVVIERDGRYLLFRGQRPGVLERMWEFPTLDSRLRRGNEPLPEALYTHLASLGIVPTALHPVGTIRHGITDRRIRCRVFRAPAVHLARIPNGGRPNRRWASPQTMASLPLAASARKIHDLLASLQPGS